MEQITSLVVTITEDGKWKIKLPPGVDPEDIILEPSANQEALLEFKPLTLGEIIDAGLLGGWEDIDPELNSVEWVQNLRRSM